MRELLEYLARALVDEPDSVSVEQFEEDDGTIVLELAVAEDDYGKIIGRGETTWKEPSSPCGRPTTPPASQSGGPVTSVDDVDEHAAVLLDRRGLHDRPQGVGGAPAAPDDLAVVVLGDTVPEAVRSRVTDRSEAR